MNNPFAYSYPEEWPYKQQTRFKHEVLSSYLTRWMAILGRPRPGTTRTMHFVDCFAGRGRYAGNEPGSPIIAMEIGQKLHEKYETFFLECHNVERDLAVYNALRWETEVAQQDFPDVYVRNHHGRFENRMDEIFADIPEHDPTLVFLDPYRILEMETVIRLLNRRYNEVLITFMSSFVNRFLGDRTKESTWDAVFHTGSWRELRHASNRQERIVRLYGRQIQERAQDELGLKNVLVYPIGVRGEGRDSDIYHLIHVSQHPKARLAMEQAVASASLLQQEAMPLFSLEVENSMIEILRSTGRTKVLDLAGLIWREHWEVTWAEVTAAILSLESSNIVGVEPHRGRNRTKGGLREKDVVFLRGG